MKGKLLIALSLLVVGSAAAQQPSATMVPDSSRMRSDTVKGTVVFVDTMTTFAKYKAPHRYTGLMGSFDPKTGMVLVVMVREGYVIRTIGALKYKGQNGAPDVPIPNQEAIIGVKYYAEGQPITEDAVIKFIISKPNK